MPAAKSSFLLLGLISTATCMGEDFNLGEAVRGIPTMVKNGFNQFKAGSGQMWQNGKAAKVVRQRIKEQGGSLSYDEYMLLRRSTDDTGKLVQAGFVWLFAPDLFPFFLYSYPNALPSTFESEQGRDKRYGTMTRARTRAALDFLATMEEQAAGKGRKAIEFTEDVAIAEKLLCAKKPSQALGILQESTRVPAEGEKSREKLDKILAREQKRSEKKYGRADHLEIGRTSGAGKVALLGLSQPALKAGNKLIGNAGPQPGPMRRGALGKHLEKLVQEDRVLLNVGTDSLSHTQLLEACLDRGCGCAKLNQVQLKKQLDAWLDLVQSPSPGKKGAAVASSEPEPHRLRLAIMATCAAGSVRSEQESLSVLPRLLYK
jgi:hypothetical protein